MRALLRSFRYAAEGIVYVTRTQRNARIHIVIGCLVIVAGIGYRISSTEWAIVALTIGMVFSAEMFNTVAERIVDLYTQRFHPMAKIAKDAGAGAVLIAAISAVVVGIADLRPSPVARFLWAVMERDAIISA